MHVRGVDREAERTGVRSDLPGRGLHHEFGVFDPAVEELRGAQFLDEVDAEIDGAGPGRTDPQILGAQADFDCGAVEERPGRMSATARRPFPIATVPSPSTRPGRMFIAGEPMKLATKRVCGRR